MRDLDRWKDKIEISLDNRQVFFLFFGSALAACLLFVVGVLVGKRLESSARPRPQAAAANDPLAVLDRLGAEEEVEEGLTFQRSLGRNEQAARGDRDPLLAQATPRLAGAPAEVQPTEESATTTAPAAAPTPALPAPLSPAPAQALPPAPIQPTAQPLELSLPRPLTGSAGAGNSGNQGSAVTAGPPASAAPASATAARPSSAVGGAPQPDSLPTRSAGQPLSRQAIARMVPPPPVPVSARLPDKAAATPPGEKADPKTPAGRASAQVAGLQSARPAAASAASATPAAEPGAPDRQRSGKGRFSLQVSAFQERAEAEEFARRLQGGGFRPYVVAATVPGRGTWYRVRVGDYATEAAAMQAKAEFERKQKMIAYVARP